jgi:uncharacterized protein
MRFFSAGAVVAVIMLAPSLAKATDYAPIDCSKADSIAQRTICSTYSLGQAEARMATLFGIATSLVAMGQRGDIGDAQLRWLKTREACGESVACLAKAYSERIRELNKVISDIASRGPY